MEAALDDQGSPLSRIQAKAAAAAVASSSVTGIYCIGAGRPVLRTVVPVTLNCVAAMATLGAAQEGVRALRGGRSDAWGTFVAGSLTGAALVGFRGGRAYALLGAVTWGPACAAAHAANDWLKLGRLVEGFLITQGLLDEPGARGAPAVGAAGGAAGGAAAGGWRARRAAEAAAAEAEERRRRLERIEAERRAAAAREQEPWMQFLPEEADLEFEQLPNRRQKQLLGALKDMELRELNQRLEREAAERAAARAAGGGAAAGAATGAGAGRAAGGEEPRGAAAAAGRRGQRQGGAKGDEAGDAAAGAWWSWFVRR